MYLLTDSKHLKIKMNDIVEKWFYERIIKKYGYTSSNQYRYVIRDKRNGVILLHSPRAPFMNYTTSLIFQGYSNGSELLSDIFSLIPLHRWKARRIDIALDTDLPYAQLHAVHPPKRADVEAYRTSIYLGSHSSPVQLHVYDKQAQLSHAKGKLTDTWTRVELRFRFEPMKRISDLTIDDFTAAKDYQIITDISGMPQKLQDIVRGLNRGTKAGGIEWKDVTRTNQAKIREYGITQGLNLFDLILSNVDDLLGFIYTHTPRANERTS